MSDSDSMNELLTNFVRPEGSSLFVSNGEIVIPFEDGESENNKQKLIRFKSERNKVEKSVEVITHTSQVVEIQLEELLKQKDYHQKSNR